MIEQKIISYLNENMEYPAFGELPEEDMNGERFAVVVLHSQTRRNFIDMATVNLYCYGESEADASEFAYVVRDVVLSMNTLDEISSVKVGSISRSNDLSEKRYRYEVTMNFWFYED